MIFFKLCLLHSDLCPLQLCYIDVYQNRVFSRPVGLLVVTMEIV